MRDALDAALLDKKERRSSPQGPQDRGEGQERKCRTDGEDPGKRVYVLGFEGDMARPRSSASPGRSTPFSPSPGRSTDEVVLPLDSFGGTVTGYGLAAAEVLRLRERKITGHRAPSTRWRRAAAT